LTGHISFGPLTSGDLTLDRTFYSLLFKQEAAAAQFTPTLSSLRVIEGKIKGRIEVTGRRGRRRRKLLDDLKERRGYSNLK